MSESTRRPPTSPDPFDPIGRDEFLTEWWERRPLHIARNDPPYYAHLGSVAAAEALLGSAVLCPAEIELVKSGKAIAAPTNPIGLVDSERMLAEYGHGTTVRLYSVNRFWPAVDAVRRSVERSIGFSTGANLYITPKLQSGAEAHFDDHNVLLLQVAGEKTWVVSNRPEIAAPLRSGQGACSDDSRVHVLRSGDLLYIPRGHTHIGTAGDSTSLHVTFGVHAPTWRDSLHAAVDAMALRSSAFRQTLPAQCESDESNSRLARDSVAHLADALRLACESDEFVASVLSGLLPPPGHAPSPQPCGDLEMTTKVRKRSDLTYRVELQSAAAYLVTGPRRLRFAGRLLGTLRALTQVSLATFSAADLPDTSSDTERLALVDTLLEEGVVVLAFDERGSSHSGIATDGITEAGIFAESTVCSCHRATARQGIPQ